MTQHGASRQTAWYTQAVVLCAAMLAVYGVSALVVVTHAAETVVAVASNFAAPMHQLATAFQKDTGHTVKLAVGSTGKLYAQIKNGAPFDVLLAADDTTPARLEKEGFAVSGTRVTYATGRLALWSKHPNLVDDKGEVLQRSRFEESGIRKIAVADPKLAPYGVAAMDVIHKLGVQVHVTHKLVQGESIGQAYQFVSTENAQLGFVALSQITLDGRITQGSAWVVPQTLHAPLKQEAVLLKAGKDNAAAHALLQYLQGNAAKTLIARYGYAL